MPIKGLILILLLVIAVAIINRDTIYNMLQNAKHDDDEIQESPEDEE